MNHAKVISVNPGLKTAGELNLSKFNLEGISRSISAPADKKASFKRRLDFFFGINAGVNSQFSSKMMAVRVMGAVILCGLALMSLFGSSAAVLPHNAAVITLLFGVSLAFGLLTRMAAAICTLFFGISFVSALTAGSLDLTILFLGSCSALFMIMGPGMYSTDLLLRRRIHKMYRDAHRYDPSRNPDNIIFDYTAFSNVEQRVR